MMVWCKSGSVDAWAIPQSELIGRTVELKTLESFDLSGSIVPSSQLLPTKHGFESLILARGDLVPK